MAVDAQNNGTDRLGLRAERNERSVGRSCEVRLVNGTVLAAVTVMAIGTAGGSREAMGTGIPAALVGAVFLWAAAAKVLGLKPEQVRLNTMLAGGGFGRRANPVSDYVVEACEIAIEDVVVAPIPISNPTVGTGLAVVVMPFYHLGEQSPLSNTAVALGYTSSGSWAVGAAQSTRTWLPRRRGGADRGSSSRAVASAKGGMLFFPRLSRCDP